MPVPATAPLAAPMAPSPADAAVAAYPALPPLSTELAAAHRDIAAKVGTEQYLMGLGDLLTAYSQREAELAAMRDRFASLWELETVG